MTINKRRSRLRRSNTPPPPAVGDFRVSQLPIPPPAALPHEHESEHEDEHAESEDEEALDRVLYQPTPALPPVAPQRPDATLASAAPAKPAAPAASAKPPPPAASAKPPPPAASAKSAAPAAPAKPLAPVTPPPVEEKDYEDEAGDEDEEEEDEALEEEKRAEEEEEQEEGDEEPSAPADDAETTEIEAVGAPRHDAETEPLAAPPAPATPRWIPLAILVATAVGVLLWVRFRGHDAQPTPRVVAPVVSASVAALPRLPTLSTAEPDIDRSLDDASVLDFEAAKAERKQAVLALEKHDIVKALDLATQAVGHDPQDAEGWLILGAAHIYKGDFVNSRNAFKTCVDVAKVGRRDECAALLH